jgi:flagellar basal body rod protein FlgG
MSTGIWSAASGAVGKTTALDVAADNVANATTPGFRAETAVFRQTLAGAVDRSQGTQSLRYAITRTNVPQFATGQIVDTGKPLDAAIQDPNGFFVVQTPEGERYTRAGSFRLNDDGSIVLPDGSPVLGENRRPIKLDATQKNVHIDNQGQIVGGDTVDGPTTPLGKLLVVKFDNLAGLQKQGHVLMRALPQAGAPTAYDGEIAGGCLEQSNVNAVQGMTQLVTLSREFEMITKVIEAFSQVDRKAATDIASSR